MPASVKSLWMASEQESCKVSSTESRRDKSKYSGKNIDWDTWSFSFNATLFTEFPFFFPIFYRDLSMILCDPFACNTLVLSIMRNLQELLSQDALPRVSSIFIMRMYITVFLFASLFMSLSEPLNTSAWDRWGESGWGITNSDHDSIIFNLYKIQ